METTSWNWIWNHNVNLFFSGVIFWLGLTKKCETSTWNNGPWSNNMESTHFQPCIPENKCETTTWRNIRDWIPSFSDGSPVWSFGFMLLLHTFTVGSIFSRCHVICFGFFFGLGPVPRFSEMLLFHLLWIMKSKQENVVILGFWRDPGPRWCVHLVASHVWVAFSTTNCFV